MSAEGCGADAGYPTPGGGAPGRRVPQSQPSRQNPAYINGPRSGTAPASSVPSAAFWREPLQSGRLDGAGAWWSQLASRSDRLIKGYVCPFVNNNV